jgi:ABC-2 type transport system ATP-binding protein
VGLATAILHDPAVLILDEPTVGLDPKQIIAIRDLIRDLGRERTLLLSTHILPEVELLCQRVMIIDRGRIIAQGTPESLRQQWLGRTVVTVTLKQGSPDAADRLRALDGVLALEANGAAAGAASASDASGSGASASSAPASALPTHFSLECAEGSDPREAVFRLAVERGWILLELKQSKASLEDIFVRLTTHEEDEQAIGSGAEA